MNTICVEPPHVANANNDLITSVEMKKLSQLSTWRSLAAIGQDWGIIASCILVSTHYPNVLIWIGAFVVIAARQHALLILMHEAAHYRISVHHIWNDRLSNWLLAWPLLVTTEGYRQNHLAHHFHLNTDEDPDWIRKTGRPDWEFPKTKLALFGLLLKELFGGGFLGAIRSIRDLSGNKFRKAQTKSSTWERVAYYLILSGVITYFQMWPQVLLLWFLPVFTALTVILRVRSIAEHFGVEGTEELNMSRNTNATFLERLLFAPHQSGYHLDHHLFPSVPFYNLPKLHAILETHPEYSKRSHQSQTLFGPSPSSLLTELTKGA